MRNRTVWIAVAIVVAAAAAGGIVWGIGQNSGSPSGGTTGGDHVSAAQISQHGGRYRGRTMVVTGPVLRVLGPHGVELGTGGPNQPVLVIADSLPHGVSPADELRVTGKVFPYTLGRARELESFAVKRSEFAQFDGQFAIAANKVTIATNG